LSILDSGVKLDYCKGSIPKQPRKETDANSQTIHKLSHLDAVARAITMMALRIASGNSGQASINSRRAASSASDFAARRYAS
jgi:hypothetical protein